MTERIKLTEDEEGKLVDFISKLPVSRFNWRLIDDDVLRGIIEINEKADKWDKTNAKVQDDKQIQEIKQLKDLLDLGTSQYANLKEDLQRWKNNFQNCFDELQPLKKELDWTKTEWNNSNPSKECKQKLEEIRKFQTTDLPLMIFAFDGDTRIIEITNKLGEILKKK